MAFLLYRIHNPSNSFIRETPLVNRFSLWGTNGVIARCAARQILSERQWQVNEAELLADLVPRIHDPDSADPTGFAILDDLVPNGPEVIVGRILHIRGYLSKGYNPILITMREVLNLTPDQIGTQSTEQLKVSIRLPPESAPLIRTINYLVQGWRPSRAFSGALLWPQYWEYLTHD